MTILVTGATGNIGGAVIRELIHAGARVRALTRRPESARLPTEVEVVYGDFGEPESLAAAFEDVDAIHLINYDASVGTHLPNAPEIVARICEAGIRRVTSFRGEGRGALEDQLQRSGVEWTDFHVPVEFMSNARAWAAQVRDKGTVRAFGPTKSSMIHDADVGAAIAATLLRDGHAGRTYTLTGPEALSPSDKVRVISEVTGRTIELAEMTEEEARVQWRAEGIPEHFVDFLVDWHRNTPESGFMVLPTLFDLTGRHPRTFAQWVSENVQLFAQDR